MLRALAVTVNTRILVELTPYWLEQERQLLRVGFTGESYRFPWSNDYLVLRLCHLTLPLPSSILEERLTTKPSIRRAPGPEGP